MCKIKPFAPLLVPLLAPPFAPRSSNKDEEGLLLVVNSQMTIVASKEEVANRSVCSDLRIAVTFCECWLRFQKGILASNCCASTFILDSVSNSHACTVPSSNPHIKMDVFGMTIICVNADLLLPAPLVLVLLFVFVLPESCGCARKKDICFNLPARDTDHTLMTPSIEPVTIQFLLGEGEQACILEVTE